MLHKKTQTHTHTKMRGEDEEEEKSRHMKSDTMVCFESALYFNDQSHISIYYQI